MRLSSDWQWKKLAEVCEKPEYGYTTSAKPNGNGPLFVRTTDISNGKINWQSVPFCTEPPTDEKRYILQDGDILIARAGSVGASVIIKDAPRAIFASYLIRFRPKKELHPLYAGFFLKSNIFWAQMGSKTAGTTLPGANATNLSNVQIPIPPLSIQHKIASILDKAESAKQKRQEANCLTDEFLKSAFLEMFGDPIKNPKNYSIGEIGDVIKEVKNEDPGRFPDRVYSYIDISSVDNVSKTIITAKRIKGAEAPSRARQLVESDDILVSTVRPNLNAVAIVPKCIDNPIASTGFCVLRVDKGKINEKYLFEICKKAFFIETLTRLARGASYPAVSDNDIKKLQIPIPPIEKQQKFADLVQKVEKMKEKQRESERELNNLFNSLMQKAFRGDIYN